MTSKRVSRGQSTGMIVIPVSDDKSIIKQVLPKRSVSTLLADDHGSLARQNVSLIKKMQFLDKQRSMILDDFGTVSITSLYLIMAQRTKCITYSVRLRIDCDMPEARSFHFLP